MIFNHYQEIPFFTFPAFSAFPGIRHAIFTRLGGSSRKPFDSLNVGFHVGDDPDAVSRNRDDVAAVMGAEDLAFVNQVHGADVVVFSSGTDDRFSADAGSPSVADAMISNRPGKMLCIQVADCQPVMLYDPAGHVVAGIHNGWRGSVQNIIGRTVRCMQEKFGCNPAHIVAGIGPSMGPCCAEFIHYRKEIPSRYWGFRHRSNYFDFWEISRRQLIDAGLEADHIFLSRLCTRCRTDLFFSYRAEAVTGRFASVIGIR